jgi:hypothetical protein
MLNTLTVVNQRQVCGGPSLGTQYSLESACDTCGSGARQTGPLVLPSPLSVGEPVAMTLDSEVLIRSDLADLLHSIGISSLGDVCVPRSPDPLPFFQLLPEAVLPRFSSGTTGYVIERQCQACLRDGFFHAVESPLRLHYEHLDRKYLGFDVLATWECFGNSRLRRPFRESVLASPVLVLSQRLSEVLSQAGARVELEPVAIDVS